MAGRAAALGVTVLLLTACGGDSGDTSAGPAMGVEAAEHAYQDAYAAAWVKSCKAAVVDIRKRDARRAARIDCDQPVEQMEGNTSFDAAQARVEGRRQGAFDGCAFAWDEAFAEGGEVETRC